MRAVPVTILSYSNRAQRKDVACGPVEFFFLQFAPATCIEMFRRLCPARVHRRVFAFAAVSVTPRWRVAPWVLANPKSSNFAPVGRQHDVARFLGRDALTPLRCCLVQAPFRNLHPRTSALAPADSATFFEALHQRGLAIEALHHQIIDTIPDCLRHTNTQMCWMIQAWRWFSLRGSKRCLLRGSEERCAGRIFIATVAVEPRVPSAR